MHVRPIPRNVPLKFRLFLDAQKARTVLLQRKLLSGPELWFLRRCSRNLIFDFDDAVYQRDSFDHRGPYHRLRMRRFQSMMRTVDSVIAGNDFLSAKAREAGARKVFVIPTCIDASRYANGVFRTRGGPGDPLTLVWIGSSSTLPSISWRSDIWNELGRLIESVRLKVICDRFPTFENLTVKETPWSENSEIIELKEGHVGVSILPDDEWSRGKCGLKVLQYMSAGLPVVANPVGVHRQMVKDGWNGFLASTSREWVDAILRLYQDPNLAVQMGLRGKRMVLERYDVKVCATQFVDVIQRPQEWPLSLSSS